MHATESGPRQNSVFEGLTFTDNYKNLLVSVEEPLYDDGPRAGLNDSTGIIRILKFNMASLKPVAQYAYTIDPYHMSRFHRAHLKLMAYPIFYLSVITSFL